MPRMRRSRLLTAAVLALTVSVVCGTSPAFAQSQDTEKPATPSAGAAAASPVSLDPVTVRGLLDQGYGVQNSAAGTKTESPLIEVPASVNVSTASRWTRSSS